MLYLDSSVAVALLVNEAHSIRVDTWLIAQQGQEIGLSKWVETEVAAALSAKFRFGRIDDRLLDEARHKFSSLAASSRRLPIATQHFDIAARFAAVVDARLRGADALHMAVSSEAGAVLCTLDRGQAEAAKVLEIAFELI